MHHFIEYRPPRIAMSFVLLAVAAHLLFPLPIHEAMPAAAIVSSVAGFALMIRAWWLFRLAGTAICPTETSTAFVTQDVFSFSRNPMYLGIVIMLGGLALKMATAPFYVAAIGYWFVMDRNFCPYEERKAAVEFGEHFAEYQRTVRRWL